MERLLGVELFVYQDINIEQQPAVSSVIHTEK